MAARSLKKTSAKMSAASRDAPPSSSTASLKAGHSLVSSTEQRKSERLLFQASNGVSCIVGQHVGKLADVNLQRMLTHAPQLLHHAGGRGLIVMLLPKLNDYIYTEMQARDS